MSLLDFVFYKKKKNKIRNPTVFVPFLFAAYDIFAAPPQDATAYDITD